MRQRISLSSKFLICALALLITTPLLIAQQNSTIQFFYAYDHETITVSSTALPFTASKVTSPTISTNSSNYVTFTVNCASGTSCVLRFLTDGGTPTASLGLRAPYGTIVQIYNHTDITKFSGIRETSTDVKLDVQYAR